MSNVTQKFTIQGVADVRDVLKGIDQIQNALKGINLGPETQASFDRLFNNIQKQADKANTAIASGFKNKKDVSNYTQAMDQIVDSYDRIITKVKVLQSDGKITLQADTAEFDALSKDLDSLNKKLKGFATEMSKATDSVNKIEQKRGTGTNNVASWQKVIDAYKKGEIQKATQALYTLKGMMTKAANNGVDFEKDKTWKQFKADYDALSAAITQYNVAQKASIKIQDEFDTKEARTKEILADAAKEIGNIRDVTEQGAEGVRKFANESGAAATETQKLSSELEQFKNKAAYFFGLSNAINLFKRSVRSAYETVKDLDAVMTETAVVTNFDVSDMWSQLPEYTQRANELGVTIHDTYEAATLFYQQGLKTNEVMQISNETLKMARIAGLDAATASDRMTNALRGFNMELDELSAKRVNDVYSKLAAITASNTDEISTAMTKVASLAHNANMEFETTAAFLAQIIESTRESAETAGTALKTVVARFSEVKKLYSKGELMGQDEEGEEIDVNKVSTALRSAGINLNEYLTGAKGLDDIFIELAEKWDGLDQVQQRYIATMAAGSRQQSRFIALMSNYKRTSELVSAANNANGASQEQYAKTLESLQTKLARLKNAWNEFILGLANSDAIKGAVDLLTGLITVINNLIKLISGKNAGVKMITTFFTAFTTFKLGANLIGKNSAISKFLAGFMGEDATKIATLKGADFAKAFYSSLADKIANPSGIKNPFNGILNYFKMPKLDNHFISDTTDIQGTLFDNLDTSLSTKEQFGELWHTVEEGNLTVGELNQALQKSGQTFRITDENASQFNIDLNKSAATMKITSAAAIALGGILMTLGSKMEDMEGPAKNWGTVIKSLGTGLVVFGTIMSVYLPLQAQLMARGVTGAIVSIPIIGWIAGIIAALVALGVAIHSFIKNNSFETKMEKANEACKNAADAADEATKAYEKLGNAWDSLNDKYAAIDNATKGTQQWKEAIKDANNEVLSLVEQYDGLQTRIGEDGRLEITEESKEAVTNKLGKAQENAQAASIGAQLAKNRIIDEKARAGYDSWNILGGYIDEKWTGANGKEYTEDKVRNEIVQAIRDGQVRNTDELKTLVKTMVPEGEYQDFIDKNITDYKFNGMKEYAWSDQFSEKSQTQFNGLISNALNKMRNQDSIGYGKNLIDTKVAENLFENELKEVAKLQESDKRAELAKRAGYDTYEDWKQNVNGGKDISETALNNELAAQNVQDKLGNFATQFENSMGKLTQEQLKYFQQEEGGALTLNEIKDLKELNGGAGIADKLGDEEYFKSLGIDRNKFIEDINKALDQAEKDASTKIHGLSEGLIDNLTAGSRKKLKENLDSIYTASGEEGAQKIKDKINELTKGLDSEQQKGFIDTLSKLDWSTANSVRDLSDLAKAYGISEDAVNELEEQIIKLNNATTQVDLKKVTDQLKSLLKIGKDINTGAQGRSFSEDQVNQLVAAGMDKDKFIYNIQTGNYDYIGDKIQDVVDAINNQTEKMFDTKQLEKDVASGQAANEMISKGKPESDADKIAFIRDYMLKAGENSKISTDMLRVAKLGADNKDYSTADKLITIIQNEANTLGDNQAKLDEYDFNKRVMKAQMNSGAINANSAINGDEAALKALMGQVSSSDMAEKLRQKLLSGMENGDEGAIRKAGNITDTLNQGKSFGVKTEEIETYIKSLERLKETQGLEEDELYRLSLAEINYQKGQQSLYDSYDDWTKLIKKNGGIVPDGSIEQGKVFSKLKDDLKQMLNLTEDLPDSFLESKDNVELLKKAVKGNKKAVEQLRTAAAKVQLKNIDIKDKDLKNKISNKIDELSKKMPDLKIGASLDSTEAGKDLMEFVNKAGMSVEDIQKLFNSLGWAPDIKWKDLSYEEAQEIAQTGTVYQRNPDGSYEPVKLDGKENLDATQNFYIPQIGPKTSKVAAKPPKKNSPKKKGGGGGKKSKKKAKKETWDNPYDELYNLQEKINESLRKREALERRYQKLLKQEQSQLSDIRKSYYDQIGQLRYEANLQKELEAGRLRQINNLGKQTYTTSKGKKTTFEKMGVTGYAHYDQEKNTMVIDWEGLEALAKSTKGTEKGKAVEAYISKLEELSQSYEQVRNDLWDIEDKIEDLRQAAVETYLSFEDRVLEAVVNKYQKEIDNYQAMSDAIDKVNNDVINSLREQIDLSRQIRDNTKKEEDISKKENRLAYLQRDTSGANDLEILSLQKELKEARENYSDELIDQAIDKMQNDADNASEQRQRQIEIMQTQLDIAQQTGELWTEVYSLMSDAAKSEIFSEDSELAKLLKDGEAFKALSNIGQRNWWAEVGKAFREAVIGKDEAEDKFQTDADNDGTIADTGTSKTINEIAESNTQANVEADKVTEHTDEEKYGVALAILTRSDYGGWGKATGERKAHFKEKGFNADEVAGIVSDLSSDKKAWDAEQTKIQKSKGKNKKGKWKYKKKAWAWKGKYFGITDPSNYTMSKFKTGGLADSTGPAWLDGTKTKPELVLNAQDTKNFITLKDILASLMGGQGAGPTSKGGDNYFDINISADIGSDYDVDRLASRIKKQIYEDGQYRNVNTINFLR